jgi:glycosyltransferase involved in cell wall biosynthesis
VTARLGIVTICRNALDPLRLTVENVRAQRTPDVEHLIVDGASTDGTRQYLNDLQGVRWISESDRGISDAMNKGARLVRGEWIAHLHAGDTYTPGAVARRTRATCCAAAIPRGWPST